MHIKRSAIPQVALAASLGCMGGQWASAGVPLVQGAPTTSEGFETIKTQAIDLGTEIPGMEGRQLRLRLLTIAPGGHIKVHTHENRPAAFYVIRGASTVVYSDGTAKRLPAGSTGYANRKTVHWHQNNEKVPVDLVVTDIFQRETR